VELRRSSPLPALRAILPQKRKPPSPPSGRYSPQEGEKQGEKQNAQHRAPFPPLLGEVAETEGRGRRGLHPETASTEVAPLRSRLSNFVGEAKTRDK